MSARQSTNILNMSKAEMIVCRLLAASAGLKYGAVSVTMKLHDGRITDVTYSTTEQNRESEKKSA